MQIIRKKYNWASPLFKRNKTNRIILHHAQAKTCSVEDIHQWHLKKGWSGIGYHFLVRKDGMIYQGRPEDTIGAHAKGANHDSIGICAEGDFMKEEMNPLQLNALIDLVSYIKNKYHLSSIKRHCFYRLPRNPFSIFYNYFFKSYCFRRYLVATFKSRN